MLGASCANVNMGIKEICCLMRAYEASPLGSRWERRVFFLFEFSAHSYPLRRSLPRCRLSQLLACHVATRCKQLDEQQNALMEDNRRNLAEINRLRQQVSQLHSKLEVADNRSVHGLQKQAEVLEKLRRPQCWWT
ncbi:unnamed protein product [Durusdinium trenchii]|uniref:Uncharacterized protein n=1 Tax=Durusdinium trenchii TaxID=1381693 RepID=A0ABP0RZN5_9DINO